MTSIGGASDSAATPMSVNRQRCEGEGGSGLHGIYKNAPPIYVEGVWTYLHTDTYKAVTLLLVLCLSPHTPYRMCWVLNRPPTSPVCVYQSKQSTSWVLCLVPIILCSFDDEAFVAAVAQRLEEEALRAKAAVAAAAAAEEATAEAAKAAETSSCAATAVAAAEGDAVVTVTAEDSDAVMISVSEDGSQISSPGVITVARGSLEVNQGPLAGECETDGPKVSFPSYYNQMLSVDHSLFPCLGRQLHPGHPS